MTEQSRIQRYRAAIPVKFFGLESITPVGEGVIVDISKGGAKIYSAMSFPQVDKLILQIMLSADIVLNDVHASVAHYTRNQHGCFIGLKFTSLPKSKMELLITYVTKHQYPVEEKS
ncbi:MAG: PilZ domain-containing protein [bacterium]|jgi:hypothetical protein|nr:PilZ domain-containing protein [bacterium]